MPNDITEVKETSKTWFLNILSKYKKPLSLIFIGVISVIVIVLAFNSYGKDYVTGIINDLIAKQFEAIDMNYKVEMEKRDNQIKELQDKLLTSEQTYANIKKRVKDVETKVGERKAPTNPTDLRNRFNQLDFKPVN